MAILRPTSTVPVTITINVPIQAVAALRNSTNNDGRIAALTAITTAAGCEILRVVEKCPTRASSELHLLALPRELRDHIWRYALVVPDTISVVHKDQHAIAFKFPLCWQHVDKLGPKLHPSTSAETLSLSTSDPSEAPGWRIGPDRAMWRLMLKSTIPVRRTIRYEISYGPSDSGNEWENLMAWLRVYHAGKGVGLPTEKQRGYEAAQPAFDIVQSLMGVDWATVSSVLEDYRSRNWQAVPDLRVGQQSPPGDATSRLERATMKQSVILG
ncbi:hypothetical protein LTR17_021943 [Elasticomyces elasticus]|nr:hypothetical protein LTR17_021943 [Elasticomyces elasticus]